VTQATSRVERARARHLLDHFRGLDRMSFRRDFLVLKDGKPLRDALEPWQIDNILAPLDARTPAGMPVYRLLYIELPRGHAKTTIAAAEALTELATSAPFRRVYAFATDEKQADLLRDAAAGFVRRNAQLSAVFKIERGRIVVPENDSHLEVMSADDASAYGLTPDLVVFDEIGKLRKTELWFAAHTSIAKQPHARILCISSPGFRRSLVAWGIREAARTTAGYYLFSPGQRLATWLDNEEFERQRNSTTQPEFVFRREQLGQWTDGDGAFITAADLARCPRHSGYRTTCSAGAHVLAIDLGLKRDRTAAAVMHRDRGRDQVVLDDLRVWQGSRDDPVLIAEVEDYMRRVVSDFSSVRFVIDPWQMQSTIQRFSGRQITEFSFGRDKARLTQNLYALVHNGHLSLANDPELDQELLDVQIVEKAKGYVIDHEAGQHDDRVIAVGMGALELMTEPPPYVASAYIEPSDDYRTPQGDERPMLGGFSRHRIAAMRNR
jgi:phage terminase large subunit-like protein